MSSIEFHSLPVGSESYAPVGGAWRASRAYNKVHGPCPPSTLVGLRRQGCFFFVSSSLPMGDPSIDDRDW